MDQIMECIPNFSEGRDLEKVEKIAGAFRAKERVKLLDYSTDKDHKDVYKRQGDGELSLDGETVRFSKGEAVLAQKGEPLLRSGGASVFMLCEMTETES